MGNQGVGKNKLADRLLQLMGHPIFGGLRVTLYNSVPQDAIVAAAEFMARFAEQNRHLVEKA